MKPFRERGKRRGRGGRQHGVSRCNRGGFLTALERGVDQKVLPTWRV